MILALETTSPTTKLWLGDTLDQSQPTLIWDSGRELADGLLGKIDGLLTEASLKPADLTGIIIFSGPGSFTSLRIGHTVANSLGDGIGIPVVGSKSDAWLADGQKVLESAGTDARAFPFYGAEANITRPKA